MNKQELENKIEEELTTLDNEIIPEYIDQKAEKIRDLALEYKELTGKFYIRKSYGGEK